MTRMLVVATVAPTIRGFLLPFAEHYRNRGWRVDAIADSATSCPQCRESFDHVWDMNWSRNPLAPRNMLTCRRQIRSLVEREGYDLVHVHTPVAAFVTRFAALSFCGNTKPNFMDATHRGFWHFSGTVDRSRKTAVAGYSCHHH